MTPSFNLNQTISQVNALIKLLSYLGISTQGINQYIHFDGQNTIFINPPYSLYENADILVYERLFFASDEVIYKVYDITIRFENDW